MNVLASAPVLVLIPIALAWAITRRKRIRPTNDEIISRIHKGELDKLKGVTPHDSAMDVLEEDRRFWECTGGHRGLLRKRENAVCFVQLGQSYVVDSKMNKRDVQYLSRRSYAIGFLALASIPEDAIRLIWWDMPHFCARWIAYLYFEAATQTNMLNLEYGTGHLTL